MKTDEVYPAFQMTQQADECISVPWGVVEAFEHSVFETYPPLPGKVILPYHTHHLSDGPGLLDRHHPESLFRKRIVQAYSQMTTAILQIALEIG